MGMNVTGHDADLDATGGIRIEGTAGVAGAGAGLWSGCDDTGAVRPDEVDFSSRGGCGRATIHLLDDRTHADHVLDWNALGDGTDDANSGGGGLENGIGGEGRGNEDHGGISTGGTNRLFHAIEDWQAVLVGSAAFAGRGAADDTVAVFEASFGVDGTERAGDALTNDAGIFIDENGHSVEVEGMRALMQASGKGAEAAGNR